MLMTDETSSDGETVFEVRNSAHLEKSATEKRVENRKEEKYNSKSQKVLGRKTTHRLVL